MTIETHISIDDYHSQTDYCSHSRFRDFVNKGARFFFETYYAKTLVKTPSPAMLEGRAFEALVQEGDAAFEALVWVQTEENSKLKHVQAARAAAKAAGKIILKPDDYARMQTMRASLYDNAEAMQLIEPADAQTTLRGMAFGLPMQSRPDWFGRTGIVLSDYYPYTADLKTCNDLSQLRQDKLYRLGYHTQAALCRALMRAHGFADTKHYLIAVESTGAHRTQVIELDEVCLDWADLYYHRHAPALEACMRTNTWPRAEPAIKVGLPHWVERPSNTNAPMPDEVDAYETDEADEQEPTG